MDGGAPGCLKSNACRRFPLVDERVFAVGDGTQNHLEPPLASCRLSQRGEELRSPLDILLVETRDDHQIIGQITGANAGLIGEARATIDEHVIEKPRFLDRLLEGPDQGQAIAYPVEVGQTETLETGRVVAVEPTRRHNVKRPVRSALRQFIPPAVTSHGHRGRLPEQGAFAATLHGVAQKVDDPRLGPLLGSGHLGGEVRDTGRFEIHVDDEDTKPTRCDNPRHIDDGHAAADAALERVERDEGAGPLQQW